MQPKTLKLLEDIRDAATFILHAVRQDDRRLQATAGLRRTIERKFGITGEAMKRLTQSDAQAAASIAR